MQDRLVHIQTLLSDESKEMLLKGHGLVSDYNKFFTTFINKYAREFNELSAYINKDNSLKVLSTNVLDLISILLDRSDLLLDINNLSDEMNSKKDKINIMNNKLLQICKINNITSTARCLNIKS